MPSSSIEFQAVPSIGDIPAEAWDACANPGGTPPPPAAWQQIHAARRESYNPFVAHAFYQALEASRSACPRTGWAPQHLIAKRRGELVGVVPCYLKSHSRGEYVFDAGWADAYERAGGRYYPKLQVSVPFTPATGPRLLVRAGRSDADAVRDAARQGLMALCRTREASSVHVTFARKDEWELLAQHGFLQRTDQQFHWENQGYAQLRRFPRRAAFAQAQADQARARARRSRTASPSSRLTGTDLTEARLGRLLQVLHGHRLAQMGLAPTSPATSIRASARRCPTTSCW